MFKSGKGLFRRPVFLTLVLLCIVFLSAGVSALESEGAAIAQQGPVNPEFLSYVDEMEGGTLILPGVGLTGGNRFGLIPSPVTHAGVRDLPISVSPDGAPVMEGAPFPVTYDLRTYTKVSPVKNQGIFGTCWAQATYASLESTFMPAATLDFSEKNLANNAGFDIAIPDGGGNMYMSTAALAGWRGPVNEATDRYPLGNQWSASPYLSPTKHVQEVIFFPCRTSRNNTANIKAALTNYGAVYSALYWDNSFYNSTSRAYYQPNSSANPTSGGGHAVTIIGWNDNYPRTNFKKIGGVGPTANGAWLVKNSWGTAWGNSGYFWVSYYDKYFGSALSGTDCKDTALFRGEATTNYNGIYSYDKLGYTTDYWYGTTKTGTYANIFTATSAAKIAAVGLYTTDMNVPVNIKIYKNPTTGPVTGGTLAYTCHNNTCQHGVPYREIPGSEPGSGCGGQQVLCGCQGNKSDIRLLYPC